MKNTLLCKIVFIITVVLFCFPCYAQILSSSELIINAKQYDGESVTYQGEVVGDIMIRGDYAWLSVNDGSNAIGVWINKELIKDISYAGSYKAKGDIIEISGIFWRSCLEHGGDLDIHVQHITKMSSGWPIYRAITLNKTYISFLLLVIILLTYVLIKFIPTQRKIA